MAGNGIVAAFLLLAGMAMGVCPAQAEESSREYTIKAGFIYNFTRFVQWPDAVRAQMQEKGLVLCIAGENPFGAVLERMAEKLRDAGGGSLHVRPAGDDPGTCHILYIHAAEEPRLEALLKKIARTPVLTVADSPGFAQRGTGVNFYIADNKIKFEINRQAVERAGLRIGSELLDLARIVEGREP
jgi:hypothetical protein